MIFFITGGALLIAIALAAYAPSDIAGTAVGIFVLGGILTLGRKDLIAYEKRSKERERKLSEAPPNTCYYCAIGSCEYCDYKRFKKRCVCECVPRENPEQVAVLARSGSDDPPNLNN